MMASRLAHVLSVAFVAGAVTGCASANSRFYTLDSTAAPQGARPASYAVLVGPVSLPASVDRPQFVLQVAPNRVELDEFNRWAAPLDDSIARAVAGNLAVLLGTSRVAPAPFAYGVPDYQARIDVQRFEAVPGETVLVDAVWAVDTPKARAVRSGRTVARDRVEGPAFDALPAALSRALETVSSDIAAAIRAEAGSTR